MYIVTIDNPYYPHISYCETMDKAQERQAELIKDNSTIDGTYKVKVVIAEIKNLIHIKTHY